MVRIAQQKRDPSPRKGRPSKLTPEVQDRILTALRAGNFFSVACELAGISETAGREWLARGNGTTKRRGGAPEFAAFAEAVKKAESEAEVASVLRIRKAAKGGEVIKKKTVTKYDAKGNVKEQIEETEYSEPVWQADAWFLERKFNTRWGRRETMKPSTGEHEDNRPVINIIRPEGKTL